ncbi:MAG: division/cell wall cluster transcriptional repressor MraZ [Bacteroidia bacterium]
MTYFLGEFACKADIKGRILLPAGLKKQLPPEADEKFVINRGFEQNLVLYPRTEWERITSEINKLNPYNKKNREFIRYFFRGATELQLDSNGRLLLPKPLLQYAGIDKDMILFAHTGKIEVWGKQIYDNMLSSEPEDFADLAEEVMGNKRSDDAING